jgi:hypothetical protein
MYIYVYIYKGTNNGLTLAIEESTSTRLEATTENICLKEKCNTFTLSIEEYTSTIVEVTTENNHLKERNNILIGEYYLCILEYFYYSKFLWHLYIVNVHRLLLLIYLFCL